MTDFWKGKSFEAVCQDIRDADVPLTYQETLGPAMEVQTVEQAAALFEALCIYLDHRRQGRDPEPPSRESLATQVRSNLGYYAGYYSDEVQAKAERLYGAVHPIFGSVRGKQMTAEEVFRKGVEMGKAWVQENQEEKERDP